MSAPANGSSDTTRATEALQQVLGPRLTERVMANPVAQQVAAHPATRRVVDVAQRPAVQRVIRSPWGRRMALGLGLWTFRRMFGLLRRPVVWIVGGIVGSFIWMRRRSLSPTDV